MHVTAALLSLAALASAAAAAPAAEPQTTARARPDWRTRTSTTTTTTTRATTTTVKWFLAPTSSRAAVTTSAPSSSPTTTSTTSVAPTTTTATTTTAAAVPTYGPSKKKGVGLNTGSFAQNLNVSWAYSWGETRLSGIPAAVEFTPMKWNGVDDDWLANAQTAINQGSKHLLGMNEPDLDSQANMSVDEVVTAWKKWMSPFYGKATLVSPAVTNGGAPMGIAFLEAFRDACPECWSQIGAASIHWYDAAWHTGYFTNYLTEAYQRLGKPIWLTEFAGSGTSEEQQTFLKYVIPWMEKQDFIERYAGFGAFAGNYVNADGSLTQLGQVYAST
ncbi:hypothetical protein JCM10207_008255 [Rhodosporidiobolus poonsookiae]